MKKLFAIAAVLAALALAAYLNSDKRQEEAFISAAAPEIKNISIRTEKFIRYELGEESVKYIELFNQLEEHITETENKIIELQSISNDANHTASNAAVKYLKACHTFLRSALEKGRKEVAAKVSFATFSRASSDQNIASGAYPFDYQKIDQKRAASNLIVANNELGAARLEFIKAEKELSSVVRSVSGTLPADVLIPREMFAKLSASITIQKLVAEHEINMTSPPPPALSVPEN